MFLFEIAEEFISYKEPLCYKILILTVEKING